MDKFIRNEQMRKHVKHRKSDRAITLIALIVTIIILLVLAGVVINLALNNKGLFSRAKISTRKWKEGEGNEQQSLQDVVDYIDGMNGIKERIDADVKKALEYADSMGAEEDDTIDPTPGILDGDGTESNPYKIQSIEDLVAFSYNVNSGTNTYKDKTVVLQRNLHFDGSYNSYANPNAKYELVLESSTVIGYKPSDSGSKSIKELVTTDTGFIPISNSPVKGRSLEGNFDGGNHRLVGLYEKDNAGFNAGLFGWITSPIKISNLSLRDGSTGGIVGYVASDITISNCYNAPSKTDNLTTGGIIGSIVRYNNTNNINATISHCYNIGKNKSGGIIGQASLVATIKMDNCYNTGDVTDTSSSSGGIIGFCVGNVIIEKCYNTGKVANGAGIAGQVNRDATIENCYNTADVVYVNGGMGGGIISQVFGKLTATECYNTGNITGSSYSGGIIGMAHSVATIENCHNTGKVTGGSGIVSEVSGNATITGCSNTGEITGSSYSGGIIGIAESAATIEKCYNAGNITGSYSGGIIGESQSAATIENCHNTGKVTGGSGIVSQVNGKATITDCSNTGEITGSSSYNYLGGIAGQVDYATIENCHNTGKVTGGSGIVSHAIGSATITDCSNTGEITDSSSHKYLGGIAGQADHATIENCYNTGNITGESIIGGIIGFGGTTVINCYNTGTITGTDGLTGGIIGSGSTAINCYNQGDVTSKSFTGGIMAGGETATNCYNTGTITGTGSDPTCGILSSGRGRPNKSTNCHNTGDIKMNTPDPNKMYEIGVADNTCTYLLKSTNAQPENAIGKNESEMKQIMDLNKFVELMNKKVEENNSDSNNTKLKKWELKDQMPVFSNN